MLFTAEPLDAAEQAVLDWVTESRMSLHHLAGGPKTWSGLLRRVSFARAMRGSNSIEGYHVSLDDALAAADDSEPMNARAETWAAITGYRNAMTFVLQLSEEFDVTIDLSLIRSLHYTMLRHDLDKRPGRWRAGSIFVVDEATGRRVYEGPDVSVVPRLMEALVQSLTVDPHPSVTIRAALAHLNLAMIHPFRDGNGRMARALQTLVLSREGVVSPMLCSVEEYLGRHQQAYYDVLTEVGQGAWHPERSTRPWVRFMLTAHYRQSSTLIARAQILNRLWDDVEQELERAGLPERAVVAVCEAARGAVLRRQTYMALAEVEERTAGRDLKTLTEAGYLRGEGEKRGRLYTGSPAVRALYDTITAAVDDPDDSDPFEELARAGALRPAREALAG